MVVGWNFLSLSLKKLLKMKNINKGRSINEKISQDVPASLNLISNPYIFDVFMEKQVDFDKECWYYIEDW